MRRDEKRYGEKRRGNMNLRKEKSQEDERRGEKNDEKGQDEVRRKERDENKRRVEMRRGEISRDETR